MSQGFSFPDNYGVINFDDTGQSGGHTLQYSNLSGGGRRRKRNSKRRKSKTKRKSYKRSYKKIKASKKKNRRKNKIKFINNNRKNLSIFRKSLENKLRNS